MHTVMTMQQVPKVGTLAPDFSLPCTTVGGDGPTHVSLADYRGRWLVVVFYPRDFSLVCPTELTGLSGQIHEFRQRGGEVLGVSCDTVETHERWIATPRAQGGVAGLSFPLASDEDGSAAQAYGVYLEYQHVSLRGLFIIDPNGVLQYQVVHNLSVGRRAEEIVRVLAALQTGGLCEENWSAGQPTLDPTRQIGPGSLISHYRVEERIGSGSFATVFRATDLTLRRQVALKVLRPDVPMTPSTALAEARSAAALNHPNVCTVFAVDDAEGVPLIAMEFLSGRSLSAMLKEGGLGHEKARDVSRQVALGMSAAHAQEIVHGDLKPDNVIVTHEGVAKILDFGLSRRDRRALDPTATLPLSGSTESDGLYGTPTYMAPELARGSNPSSASDVFAFGAMLYEMVTGRKAFPGSNLLQVLQRVAAVDPELLAAELPEPFAPLLRQALHPDPGARRISMADLAASL